MTLIFLILGLSIKKIIVSRGVLY